MRAPLPLRAARIVSRSGPLRRNVRHAPASSACILCNADAQAAYEKAAKLDPKMEEYSQSAEKAAAAEQKALAEGASFLPLLSPATG